LQPPPSLRIRRSFYGYALWETRCVPLCWTGWLVWHTRADSEHVWVRVYCAQYAPWPCVWSACPSTARFPVTGGTIKVCQCEWITRCTSSSDENGSTGSARTKFTGGWAASAAGGRGTTCAGGGAASGCTGWSMYSSLFVDCVFCLAISLINCFRLMPAVSLIESIFLRSAVVPATSFSGTWYSGLNT
jgi:hypothetical protein